MTVRYATYLLPVIFLSLLEYNSKMGLTTFHFIRSILLPSNDKSSRCSNLHKLSYRRTLAMIK